MASINLGKVRGADATINGQTTLTLNTDEAASGLALTQVDNTATIKGAPLLEKAKEYTDTQINNLVDGAPETLNTIKEVAQAIQDNESVVEALNSAIGTKAAASDLTDHTSDVTNPHAVTKAQVGLGNVENKSSATIRSEITAANVQSALGYVPQQKITGNPGDTVTFDASGNLTVQPRMYKLFGFELDQTDSNPATCIKYIGDNVAYNSAHMDYTTGLFDYGSWQDAWFIKNIKPVMMNYDGTVAYELDPTNYALKKDGTDSDIADDTFAGNVMIGIPTVWYYVDTTVADKPKFWFSDIQVSSKFKAYAHINNAGEVMPYTYLPAYNGFKDTDGRMRSISGKTISRSLNATQEIEACQLNNVDGANIWYTEVLSDRMLITLLLFLIGKSTDSQTVFGNGNINGHNHDNGYSSDYGLLPTGTMNDKGLFWGSSEDNVGVKVFGIEHYWGNQWRRTAGYINDNGIQKIKMVWGNQDGSLAEGYNTTGEGYISIGDCPEGSGSFISKMRFNEYGMYPAECSGSATTYYCDGFWSNNSQVNYALFGGNSNVMGKYAGLYSINIGTQNITIGDRLGASVSCKPLLT